MSNNLRIIFAGTPIFAATHLYHLINHKYKIITILTKPDQPAGRGYSLTISPVKKLAKQYNIPIYQPYSLNDVNTKLVIDKLNVDILVVVAYGLILPQSILNIPRLGCINVHSSLLPRWRGAAPIQRALLAGDNITGITIFKLNTELDAGDIIYKKIYKINNNDNYNSLCKKLANIGSETLLLILENFNKKNKLKFQPQQHSLATYANKINKKEAKINWYLSANKIICYIKAFNPWPGSYFLLNNKIIKVWQAKIDNQTNILKNNLIPGTILSLNKLGITILTSNGRLILTSIQIEGKKIMTIIDIMNGYKNWFIPGTILN